MEETTELIVTKSQLDLIENALADHRELLYFVDDSQEKRAECDKLIEFIKNVKHDLEWDND